MPHTPHLRCGSRIPRNPQPTKAKNCHPEPSERSAFLPFGCPTLSAFREGWVLGYFSNSPAAFPLPLNLARPLLQSHPVQGFSTLRYNPSFGYWGPKFMKATYHPGIHKFAVFVVCWTALPPHRRRPGHLRRRRARRLRLAPSFGTLFPPAHAWRHRLRTFPSRDRRHPRHFWIIILASLLWRKDERPWVNWLGARRRRWRQSSRASSAASPFSSFSTTGSR